MPFAVTELILLIIVSNASEEFSAYDLTEMTQCSNSVMNKAMEYVHAVIPSYDEDHQSLVIATALSPIALVLSFALSIATWNILIISLDLK